ncbi:patatin-like phospholipase family protein [Terriglobus sp.]|uniref:patatin-like phospholipase family protein n=1 Tax=Terriglobus sp. TaxID=1889013 RepID=UPI003AFF9475
MIRKRFVARSTSLALGCFLGTAGPAAVRAQVPPTPDAAAAEAAGASNAPSARNVPKQDRETQNESGSKPGVPPAGARPPMQLAWPAQDFSGRSNEAVLKPVYAPPPPLGRKRIGVALGGGGALALSEIGVLQWFDEHHIPVDAIAGTSMGSLVAALYATGHSPAQIQDLTSDQVFSKVFRLSTDFRQINFRRREDARFLPGGFNLGLKHGVSFRNGVLLDYGLDEFLNAQFLPYGAAYDFNRMPIPFRCVATDILVGREAVFTQGPLAEAVRASISIPGVFPPLEDGGHTYVDGALTENLPVDTVKSDLHADVVIAVSLPLTPPDRGDTGSLLGILQRSFSVASWSNEVRSRSLANVLVEPTAPAGVGAADYARSADLAKAGYAAAEKVRDKLLPYRLSDAQWEQYLAQHRERFRGTLGNIAQVNVLAPTHSVANGIRDTAAPLIGKPLQPERIDQAQNEVRNDGRFLSDYFLSSHGQKVDFHVTGPANEGRHVEGRELLHPREKRGPGDETAAQEYGETGETETEAASGAHGEAVSTQPVNNTIPVGSRDATPAKQPDKPTYETVVPISVGQVVATATPPSTYKPGPNDLDLNLFVRDKSFGPPFLLIGGNVIAQTGGVSRATIDAVLTQQDFGGYRSELRTTIRFGFLTFLEPEYYKRITRGGLFVAPRLTFLRTPVYIWGNQKKVAERQQIQAGGGVDLGYTLSHFTELRAGWQENTNRWHTETGIDGLPDFNGHQQLARVLYRFNGQDRDLIPLHGLRAELNAGYQFDTVRSQNAPRIQGLASYFRDIGHSNTLSLSGEGGTFAGRNIADPFRFTLGGPLRLSASTFEEYRGTDYWLVRPAYFRRIASLPAPLGQSIYVLGTYEAGQMYSPTSSVVTRQDVFLGLAAETPLGAITFGPAIGDHDHRKIIFTLGRFF